MKRSPGLMGISRWTAESPGLRHSQLEAVVDRCRVASQRSKGCIICERFRDQQQAQEKAPDRLWRTIEDPHGTGGLKRTTNSMNLPVTCNKMPQEEFPPSPECWRKHPKRPGGVPYCYHCKPDLYTHWHALYGDQLERDGQKAPQRTRVLSRLPEKESSPTPGLCLPMRKLVLKPQERVRSLDPAGDTLKWQRLKELTKSLDSAVEHEQYYAAQALGSLGISDEAAMEALQRVAQTRSEKVSYEAYRSLAILGCLNKRVIQALIRKLKGRDQDQRMDTLRGLRMALNSWARLPKGQRTHVSREEKLVSALQGLIDSSVSEVAVEAAVCLGFLRPCDRTVQDFLLQRLCQGTKPEQMKALKMLVKMMHVHSSTVIQAVLDQLCHSNVLEHRFEAIRMLRNIGMEQIRAQKLEELTFELLRKKTYNEPFHAMRLAVAELVEDLNMKPTMLNVVEAQLMNTNAARRQEAIISLGVLGIRSAQVFHLLLDMLDVERSEPVRKSIQETFVTLASTEPWIRNKLKNKVLLKWELPSTNRKTEPTRFQNEPEELEELGIQDFRQIQLSPLLISKSCVEAEQEKEQSEQETASCRPSGFPTFFIKPRPRSSKVPEPWVLKARRQQKGKPRSKLLYPSTVASLKHQAPRSCLVETRSLNQDPCALCCVCSSRTRHVKAKKLHPPVERQAQALELTAHHPWTLNFE